MRRCSVPTKIRCLCRETVLAFETDRHIECRWAHIPRNDEETTLAFGPSLAINHLSMKKNGAHPRHQCTPLLYLASCNQSSNRKYVGVITTWFVCVYFSLRNTPDDTAVTNFFSKQHANSTHTDYTHTSRCIVCPTRLSLFETDDLREAETYTAVLVRLRKHRLRPPGVCRTWWTLDPRLEREKYT